MNKANEWSTLSVEQSSTLRYLLAASICGFSVLLQGQAPRNALHDVANRRSSEITAAATTWLASLSAEQRQRAVFSLESPERENWHFIPRPRQGLPLKEMTSSQRDLARGMVNSVLSHQGQLLAESIIALEKVLFELEKKPHRDPELYYFSVFGTPGAAAWGWRLEGHHLSLNITVVGKRVSVTPSFFGANPAEVRSGSAKGRRTLASEEDLGRAFVRSLTDKQQAQAILPGPAPEEIITGASRQAQIENPATPAGILVGELTNAQRAKLLDLVKLYAHRLRGDLAQQELDKIMKAGWERVRFAWAGGLERGEAHYYRIHGPTFVIEYDNTQSNANHIHTVWRNFQGDFGRDWLREHYAESHKTISLATADTTAKDGWVGLFDGKNINNWKISRPESFRLENGVIVANGTSSHAYYNGEFRNHAFRDFELKVDVMTRPNSNGGIYVLTEFEQVGGNRYKSGDFPSKGFEIQVNNSSERDKRKTGSLYRIQDVAEAPVRDGEWFTVYIIVKGNTITVKVNDKQTVEWTQPVDWDGGSDGPGRVLGIKGGTIALQAHDMNSTVYYKNIRIKPL